MQILGLWAFLTLAWLLGSIFSRWHLALIGELIAGALLGPGLCDVVPFAQAWTLLGELSLCFLVFDGALSLDLTKLRLVGLRAMTIAFAGVVLPVALAFGILQAFALPALTSLAAGVSLASTAIGSTAVLLKSHGLQETEMGWMIASAAIIDDVGSLVLLAIVGRLGPGSVDGRSGSLFFPATTNGHEARDKARKSPKDTTRNPRRSGSPPAAYVVIFVSRVAQSESPNKIIFILQRYFF